MKYLMSDTKTKPFGHGFNDFHNVKMCHFNACCFALKTPYLRLKVAPSVAIRSVGQAYVEKLKEQALAILERGMVDVMSTWLFDPMRFGQCFAITIGSPTGLPVVHGQ